MPTVATRRVKVDKGDPPVSKVVLAEAIVKVSEAAQALKESGLNEDAIVVLLHDKTRLPKGDIRAMLNGLRQLRAWYCRT